VRPIEVVEDQFTCGFGPVAKIDGAREQARILHLLIERVDYDGPNGTVEITFHPTGIKTLADELKRQEATTCDR
jgi:site-specific DNA recombinase